MWYGINWRARIKSKLSCWSMNLFSSYAQYFSRTLLNLASFVVSSSLPSAQPRNDIYQLDGFHLHVVRDLTEKTKTLPPSIPAPVRTNTPVEVPKPNGSVSASTTLAILKPVPSSLSIQGFLEKASDEGLVIIHSPKVRL